jgi:outer membrane biosynthesis protein TonB
LIQSKNLNNSHNMKLSLALFLIFISYKAFNQSDTVVAKFGDYQDIRIYMQKATIYPKKAIENGISGIVVFKLRVNDLGCIDSITILKNPNEILSQEVIRVLKSTDCKWTPAFYNNKPIKSWIFSQFSYVLM